MFNYTVLSRNPSIFRSFTGLETHEFDALHTKIEENHATHTRRNASKDRTGREASGRAPPSSYPYGTGC
jgi:hypothetical protein